MATRNSILAASNKDFQDLATAMCKTMATANKILVSNAIWTFSLSWLNTSGLTSDQIDHCSATGPKFPFCGTLMMDGFCGYF